MNKTDGLIVFEGQKYCRPEYLYNRKIAKTSKDISDLKAKKGFPKGFRLGRTKVYKVSDVKKWLEDQNANTIIK